MSKQTKAKVVDINAVKAACEDCSLRELCLPLGLSETDIEAMGRVVKLTRKLKKGEFLYRVGESMRSLYAIKQGSAKTCEISVAGEIQITGFHLAGELVGLDGISSGYHHCDAVALEKTEVCELPFGELEALAHEIPGLQHQMFRLLGREIVSDGEHLMMIGKMSAEQRLVACLLNFSQRFDRLGCSPTEFTLSMSRQDIGDYLGLALETVSRLFSRFQDDGLIDVEGRRIRLRNLAGLYEIAGNDRHHGRARPAKKL